MIRLLYLLLIFFAPDIFASAGAGSNFFTPAAGDESINLLGIIFGPNIGSLALGTGAPNSAMGDLMEQLNIVIVVIGTIIVTYSSILSTINTAQEGEVMGKKWSAVWTPMRSVIGMALLIPSSGSGYSMIQVTVMYIIIQGIGAADVLWNIILNDLKNGVSIVSGSTAVAAAISSVANGPTTAQVTDPNTGIGLELLSALVCMQTLKNLSSSVANQGTWLGNNGTKIQSFIDPTTQVPITPTSGTPAVNSVTVSTTMHFGVQDPTPNSIYPNICGSFKISGQASTNDFTSANSTTVLDSKGSTLATYATNIYTAKLTALNSLLNEFQNQIVAPIIAGTTPPSGLVNTAGTQYVSIVNVPIPGTDQGGAINTAVSSGEANGWIVAGSYYFVFSKALTTKLFPNLASPPTAGGLPTGSASPITPDIPMCTSNMQVSGGNCQSVATATPLTPGVSPTDGWGDPSNPPSGTAAGAYLGQLTKFMQNDDDIATLSYNLARASSYWNSDIKVGGASVPLNIPVSGASASALQSTLGPLTQSANSTINNLISMMNNSSGDPLIAHAIFGQSIMFGCEIAWLAIFSISLLISMAVGMFGIEGGLPSMFVGILGVASAFLGTMWTLGASLAIYCPLIPYFIFATAALGWLLVVAEAIIGAPLIALGLVVPSGDELGKLEAALTLLANVFLRPTLMVVGFAMAGKVYKAIVMLVDFGFSSTLNSINIGTLFSPVVILGAYCAFIISLTNSCFSLIYALPDKILRWIGGTPESSEVAEHMKEAKQGADGGAQGVSNQVGVGGNKAANAMMEHGEKRGAQVREAKEKKKEAASALAAHKQMTQQANAKGANQQMMQKEAQKQANAGRPTDQQKKDLMGDIRKAGRQRDLAKKLGKPPPKL